MSGFQIKNAVLRKDMILDMKRPKIVLLMMLINVILAAALVMAFLLLYFTAGYPDMESARSMINLFSIMVWGEEIMILFLSPALTAGAISIEKERQTLEVLLTTQMSPMQIVMGKYVSSISLVIMLILSTVPSLSVVFIFGGISLFQIVQILLVLIVSACFIGTFGVFFSALLKNTILSVILTYLTVGVVLGGTIFLCFGGMIGGALLNELVMEAAWDMYKIDLEDPLSGDIFIFVLCLNPLATLYDAIGQVFGYSSDWLFGYGEPYYGFKDIEWYIHFTPENIALELYTEISLVSQAVISALLLRAAGFFLKPVKTKASKKIVT